MTNLKQPESKMGSRGRKPQNINRFQEEKCAQCHVAKSRKDKRKEKVLVIDPMDIAILKMDPFNSHGGPLYLHDSGYCRKELNLKRRAPLAAKVCSICGKRQPEFYQGSRRQKFKPAIPVGSTGQCVHEECLGVSRFLVDNQNVIGSKTDINTK